MFIIISHSLPYHLRFQNKHSFFEHSKVETQIETMKYTPIEVVRTDTNTQNKR